MNLPSQVDADYLRIISGMNDRVVITLMDETGEQSHILSTGSYRFMKRELAEELD